MVESFAPTIPAVLNRVFLHRFFWITLLCILCSLRVAANATEVRSGVLAKRWSRCHHLQMDGDGCLPDQSHPGINFYYRPAWFS